MLTSRNPVLSRGFAYDDLDPNIFRDTGDARAAMTVEGTLQKVAFMFAPLLAVGVVAYLYAPFALALPALIVALGLALWASFSKTVRPGVMLAYAVAEGVVLGVFTAIFEARFPGIAVQAVLATLATAAAVFLLYRARIVQATSRFRKIVVFATVGYLVFLVVNFVFALLGAGGGAGVYATPLGLAVAAVGALLASAFLVLDFDMIERGVTDGVAAENEWRSAFALTLTLVWLYIEMLRFIAIVRR